VPHGTPDWWGESPTATVHQVTDMGELAVRLGSPVSYDRRGNVVWFDNFEDGLGKWYLSEVGTGADVALTGLSAVSGGYSAKLVGGSDGLMSAQLQRIFYAPVPGKVGLEMSFELRGAATVVELQAAHYDGVNYYQYYVRWVSATSDFEYQDSAGAWQDIDANKPLIAAAHAWHTMKVVFNTASGKYVRAMLDDEEYSLAGIGPQSAASAIEPTVRVRIYGYSDAGHNHYVLIDDVILTQNEP